MSEPKVTREGMLEWLDRLGKLINFEPGSPDRPFEDAIRRLIEKVGEWQGRFQIMLEIGPPEYNADDIFDLAKDIRDFGKEEK